MNRKQMNALPENWKRAVAEWKNRADFVMLLACLAIAAGVWAFIEIADEVVEGETASLDRALLLRLREPQNPAEPIGPKWLEESVRDLTALGSSVVLGLAIAVTVGYLAMRRKPGAMLLVLASSFGGALLSYGLKAWFARPRPELGIRSVYVMTESFPSGHSMLSAVIYLTLGALLAELTHRKREKTYLVAVAILLALLVGLSRLYLGVHYPTDVLAGWVAGASWALLCWTVARVLQRRGAVESEQ